jgi:ABC-type sugar transport system substrate-binding protein
VNQRELEVALRKKVFAARDEPSLKALKDLANMHLERVKNGLLRAAPDAVPALQGEGYAMATLLKWLDEPLQQKATVDNQ